MSRLVRVLAVAGVLALLWVLVPSLRTPEPQEPRSERVLAQLRAATPEATAPAPDATADGATAGTAAGSATPTALPDDGGLVTELVDGLRTEGAAAGGDADDPNAGAPPALFADLERGPVTPLGVITIPSIEVEAAFASGVHDAVLQHGPGHWPGTAIPGAAGNAVLSGHRTTYTAPFGDLDQLAAGDEVVTQVGETEPIRYQVTEVAVVPEAEYVEQILTPAPSPDVAQLTLFACHPKGSRTHRILVRAVADTD